MSPEPVVTPVEQTAVRRLSNPPGEGRSVDPEVLTRLRDHEGEAVDDLVTEALEHILGRQMHGNHTGKYTRLQIGDLRAVA